MGGNRSGIGCQEQGDKRSAVHGLKKTHTDELAEAAEISSGASYIFHESIVRRQSQRVSS
jgi:hypothetical protein